MIQEEWLKAYSDCVDKWLADHQDQLYDRAVQIAKPRLSVCTKAFESASSDPATCFRAAFCAARHAVQLACHGCDVDGADRCSNTKLIATRPPKASNASIQWGNIGCGAVPELQKTCKAECASCTPPPTGGFFAGIPFIADAYATCLKACDACNAATAQLIAVCAPSFAPSKGNSGAGLRKPSTDTSSAKVPKNNLDRFGLGPTYVDTSTSQAGTRTTSRGAAAGVKGTAGTGASMKGTYRPDAAPPTSGSSSQGGGIGASVPAQIK